MNAIRLNSVRNSDSLLFSLFFSVLITMFLFYIDEGYYNFHWMTNIGNWIVFIPYAGAIFLIQWLTGSVLFRKEKGLKKAVLALIVGLPLTFFILSFIIFRKY